MNFPQISNEGDIIYQNGKYFQFENNNWQCYNKVKLILKLKIPFYSNLLAAYKLNNNTFQINLDDAKKILLISFRETRTSLLQALDIEYMKADEIGSVELKQHIAAKKQELRDVTAVVLPDTLQELNEFWPEILS